MFKAVCIDHDDRINAWCVTAQVDYSWFLNAVSGSEANLEIQRGVIGGRKAYATLRQDLKNGCVLPPIVLAEAGATVDINENGSIKSLDQLSAELGAVQSEAIYIIDGLQRTNAIRRTAEELRENQDSHREFLLRKLRIEFWLGASFGAIAYRMLLLNAGQRPMSMKHQIEVLSSRLGQSLSTINGIDIFTTGDARRRANAGQFQLAKLSQAFQAWLQGKPNIDVRNVVMEELLAEGAIETLGNSLNDHAEGHDGFRRLMQWIVEMDVALGRDNLAFFGNETVLQGVAAAVGGSERHEKISSRVWPALDDLLADCRSGDASDVLGVPLFNQLRTTFDVSKVNVGSATRELVNGAFLELFFSGGLRSMKECWEIAATRVV
ncbi:hypothetical protein NG831_10005 [Xanthomonas sacchari]|uniref:hypothetical protein n=1 Tax=Xanthomonas sacchari TaxID=56458 RepID=UPI00225100F4|nr:hypothetical protein [Xanthomonas sacchari]MCW0411695.1 hypothetical protein [Xanthomonas sacchari]UYK68418.1 hypothetical protein NG831_10005 [Xanthomonas sacchari]